MKNFIFLIAALLSGAGFAHAACEEKEIDGFRFCVKNVATDGAPVELSIKNGKALTYGLLPADKLQTMQSLSYFSNKADFWQKFKFAFADTSIIDSRDGLLQKALDYLVPGSYFMTETIMPVSNFDEDLGKSIANGAEFKKKDYTLYTDMMFNPFSLPTVLNYVNIATIAFDMRSGAKTADKKNVFANLYNKLAVTQEKKDTWKVYLAAFDALLGIEELSAYLSLDDEWQVSVNQWVGNGRTIIDKLEPLLDALPLQSPVSTPKFTDTLEVAVPEAIKAQSPLLGIIVQAGIDYFKIKPSVSTLEAFYTATVGPFYDYLVFLDANIGRSFQKGAFTKHVTNFMVSRRAKPATTLSRADIAYIKRVSTAVRNSGAIQAAFKDAFTLEKFAHISNLLTGPLNLINNVMNSLGDEQTHSQLLQYFATEYLVSHFTSGSVDFLKDLTASLFKTMASPFWRVASAANDLGAVAIDAATAPKYVPFTVSYSPQNKADADHGLLFALPESVKFSLHSYIEDVTDSEIAAASRGFRHKVKDILLDIDDASIECPPPGQVCRYAVSTKQALLMKPDPVFYQQFYLGAEGLSAGVFSNAVARNPKIKVGITAKSEKRGDLINPMNLPMETVDVTNFVGNHTLQGKQYAAIDFKAMFKSAQNSWYLSMLAGENKTYLKLTTGKDVYVLDAVVDFNDPPGGQQASNAAGMKVEGSVFHSQQKVFIAQELGVGRQNFAPTVYYSPTSPTAVRIEVNNPTAHTLHYYLYDDTCAANETCLVERLVRSTGDDYQGVAPQTTQSLSVANPSEWVANRRIAKKIVAFEDNVARYLNSAYGGGDTAPMAKAIKRMLVEQGSNEYVLLYDGAALNYREGSFPPGQRLIDDDGQDGITDEPAAASPFLEITVADSAAAAFTVADQAVNAQPGDRITLHPRNTPAYPSFAALTGPIWVVLRQISGGACPSFAGKPPAAGYCTVAGTLTADGGIQFVLPSFTGSGRFAVAAISERKADGSAKLTPPPWEVVRVVEADSGTVTTPPVASTQPLNDTGITGFADDSQNNLASEPATHPRQDARFGRDAQAGAGKLATKIGGGEAGFDFTALDASHQATTPSAGATPHPCVRDNVTGLVWEVKTADGGLRDQGWSYTWYDSVHHYGGNDGTASGGTCKTAGRCDTEKYVVEVNASALCGYTGWRMPTVDELQGIVHLGRIDPSIDPTYFPNTPSSFFWSGSPDASYSYYAWGVNFYYGFVSNYGRGFGYSVRLVRGGQ
jgi:hypothetical protein